jgi:putative SOS response-associated peptidase YedK
MCGRFSTGASAATLAQQFNVQESVSWRERFNLAPSQEVLTLVQPPPGPRAWRRMRWGLIPAWAKDKGIGARLINARSETVATLPAFRAAFQARRCLIPADGFYEWQGQGRRKQPWCIRMADGRPFAFAGLWERWSDPAGEAIESCTILTTSPNAVIRSIHHRMPVILPPRDYDLWLDPAMRESARLLPLLVPYAGDDLVAYPVSTLVNNPANDTPACQSPIDGR